METSTVRKPVATRKRLPGTGKAATTGKRRPSGGKSAPATSPPSVVPMISYDDGIAALEWLGSAFGFRETVRLTTPDGRLSHGENGGRGRIDHACLSDPRLPQ